jgi:hypothetical protein
MTITYLELEETLAIYNGRACIWPREQPLFPLDERLLGLERDINAQIRYEWRRHDPALLKE